MLFRRPKLVFQFALQNQKTIGIVEKTGAGIGQPKALIAPVQEEHPQLLLERGNAVRDGRLGQAQFFRPRVMLFSRATQTNASTKRRFIRFSNARRAAYGCRIEPATMGISQESNLRIEKIDGPTTKYSVC